MIYSVNKRTKEHVKVIDDGDGPFGFDLGWTIVQADPDGWIEWQSGECEGPMPPGARCGIRLSSGDVFIISDPENWDWSKGGDQWIIAYRPLLSDESEPEPPAWDGESWPPPIGCVLETKASEAKAKIIAIEDGHVIGWDAEYAFSGTLEREHCRPIRSKEDRAVEDMTSAVGKTGLLGGLDCEKVARALYHAGYRKSGDDQ